MARGRVWLYHPPDLARKDQADDVSCELARLGQALQAAESELQALAAQSGHLEADILEAQRLFLSDPMLVDQTRASILQGSSAVAGWRDCTRAISDQFQAIGQEPWSSRAEEVRDVGERVLRRLLNVADSSPEPSLAGAVVVAQRLVASQVLGLVRQGALGFALSGGSPSSHAAIMAKALQTPMVMGLGEKVMSLAPGAAVLVNGDAGIVDVLPHDALSDVSTAPSPPRIVSTTDPGAGPTHTRDGRRIRVLANVSSPRDVERALQRGAEGAGLVRTEMLFLDRAGAPSEAEQTRAYAAILGAFSGKPVAIRTWDLAPDKTAWLEGGEIERLAVRGIRQSLRDPAALMAQLRALLRAGAMVSEVCRGGMSVLLPHVATVEELRAARGILDRVRDELAAGDVAAPSPQVGVMIEVPGAALMADALAREVGFISVGSNDLAQHLMAADREDVEAATLLSGRQPALLRLLKQVIASAHAAELEVTLCGELAADLASIPLMIGLGFDGLSVAPGSLLDTRSAVVRVSSLEASRLVAEALSCATEQEVRDLMHRGDP